MRTGKGRFVNYNTLPDRIWDSVMPDYFGVPVSAEALARMKNITKVYAKGGDDVMKWNGTQPDKLSDISKKQKKAVKRIMESYYDTMESYSRQENVT